MFISAAPAAEVDRDAGAVLVLVDDGEAAQTIIVSFAVGVSTPTSRGSPQDSNAN